MSIKRILCALLGHPAWPTGRRAMFLREWLCPRCGTLLISNDLCDYLGIIFPRIALPSGDKLTAFASNPEFEEMITICEQKGYNDN